MKYIYSRDSLECYISNTITLKTMGPYEFDTMSTKDRLEALVDTGALDALGLGRLDDPSLDPWTIVDRLAETLLNCHVMHQHEVHQYDMLCAQLEAADIRNRMLETQNRKLSVRATDALANVKLKTQELDSASSQLFQACMQINALKDGLEKREVELARLLQRTEQRQHDYEPRSESDGSFSMSELSTEIHALGRLRGV